MNKTEQNQTDEMEDAAGGVRALISASEDAAGIRCPDALRETLALVFGLSFSQQAERVARETVERIFITQPDGDEPEQTEPPVGDNGTRLAGSLKIDGDDLTFSV